MLNLIIITALALIKTELVCAVSNDCDDSVSQPLSVTRRSRDIVYDGSASKVCGEGQTYLVDEQRCVSEEELVAGCDYQLTERSTMIFITPTLNPSVPLTLTHMVYYNQSRTVNNCTIESLEVFRGREQVIKISHSGFSFEEHENFKVEPNLLLYEFEDYIGEVYRMNLSCNESDRVAPLSSCVFFKIRGQTTLTTSKFNCLVPSALCEALNDSCAMVSRQPAHTQSETFSVVSTTTTITTDNSNRGYDTYVTITIIIIAGCVGGVGTLCMVVLVSAIIVTCFSRKKKGKSTKKAGSFQVQEVWCDVNVTETTTGTLAVLDDPAYRNKIIMPSTD